MRCFGILPWFEGARRLPAEDALGLSRYGSKTNGNVSIAVPVFSRVANFDDLDPLAAEPDVDLVMVQQGEPIPAGVDLILLTGSKAAARSRFLFRSGLGYRYPGACPPGWCRARPLCGLPNARAFRCRSGRRRGTAGETKGLALLDVETVIGGDKTLRPVEGRELASDLPISGYEMHIGETDGPALTNPMLRLGDRNDGAVSRDGLVSGCYVHGLFASDLFRAAFLGKLKDGDFRIGALRSMVETTLDDLAAHCARHLDLEAIGSAAGLNSNGDDGNTNGSDDTARQQIQAKGTADIDRAGVLHGRRPSRRRRHDGRRKCAGPPRPNQGRRPLPPPANRHWANGDYAHPASSLGTPFQRACRI